jgi:DNA-binding PadR family transcriptional regulator
MMELRGVILGFLERKRLTGYELKSLFSTLDFLPWSGNNNQIYTSLLELERKGLVEKRTIQQEKLPAQKRYHATDAGRARLKQALLQPSDAPAFRNDFLLRLAWTEYLSDGEIKRIIDEYRLCVETERKMCHEKMRRGQEVEYRSEREAYVWGMLQKNREMALQAELKWLAQLRSGLAERKKEDK